MNTLKSLLTTIMALAMVSIFSSCEKNELVNDGIPRVNYVRITDPAASDSLLAGAAQGNLIAIVGDNLENTREIWFNDQQAYLTPTYLTNTTILVSVPSQIPLDINNTMRLVFANGQTLDYAFEVQIGEPVINSMTSEFVNTGDIATINGDYFYEPIIVTFAGGKVAENVSVEDKILKVRVPEGAEPGQIRIQTNFGETLSQFWFRDNRNIVCSSDPFTGWWNASYVVTDPLPGDPVKISGNYIRVKKAVGAWSWTEVVGGPASAMGDISKNIPDEAILHPEDYNFKFEINTVKPYNNNRLMINVGMQSEDNDHYAWQPPYDTKGQWQTVIIPFKDITDSYNVKPVVNPDGYWFRIMFFGPGDLDSDVSLDNFRVVPKIIKP